MAKHWLFHLRGQLETSVPSLVSLDHKTPHKASSTTINFHSPTKLTIQWNLLDEIASRQLRFRKPTAGDHHFPLIILVRLGLWKSRATSVSRASGPFRFNLHSGLDSNVESFASEGRACPRLRTRAGRKGIASAWEHEGSPGSSDILMEART